MPLPGEGLATATLHEGCARLGRVGGGGRRPPLRTGHVGYAVREGGSPVVRPSGHGRVGPPRPENLSSGAPEVVTREPCLWSERGRGPPLVGGPSPVPPRRRTASPRDEDEPHTAREGILAVRAVGDVPRMTSFREGHTRNVVREGGRGGRRPGGRARATPLWQEDVLHTVPEAVRHI